MDKIKNLETDLKKLSADEKAAKDDDVQAKATQKKLEANAKAKQTAATKAGKFLSFVTTKLKAARKKRMNTNTLLRKASTKISRGRPVVQKQKTSVQNAEAVMKHAAAMLIRETDMNTQAAKDATAAATAVISAKGKSALKKTAMLQAKAEMDIQTKMEKRVVEAAKKNLDLAVTELAGSTREATLARAKTNSDAAALAQKQALDLGASRQLTHPV